MGEGITVLLYKRGKVELQPVSTCSGLVPHLFSGVRKRAGNKVFCFILEENNEKKSVEALPAIARKY